MNTTVLHMIEKSKAKVIILDIDGTLKDLCEEHSAALRTTLKECGTGTIRKKLINFVNSIAMSMVKTGVFSTNRCKQSILIKVFSILSGVKSKQFTDEYFNNYINQIKLFNGAYNLLRALDGEKTVYFATINRQNYNLEECGIPQNRIVYTEGVFKVKAYEKILKDIGAEKQDVIVIGDNIFDDVLSAKLLGVKCLLVNHYNSKLKKVMCKLVNSRYLK